MLIIEDHQDTSRLARRILRNRFQVETAEDGETGLQAWEDGRHELVLLDVMLPKLSGLEALEAIMQIDKSQPVVIMTAFGSSDLAEKMLIIGAVDFITKPFLAEQLRRVCELAVHREDYLVSNAQFAARLDALQQSTRDYRIISEKHQRLLDNLSTVVFELDSEGRIRFLNQAWTRLSGHSVENTIGNKLTSFLADTEQQGHSSCKNKTSELLSGLRNSCKFELPLINADGQQTWAECKLDAATGKSSGSAIFGSLSDISKRKKAQNQLEFQAMHDSLTGLKNRHFFDISLAQLATSAARSVENHALLYIDLDHFKMINDTFGHNHGDIVLRDISALLSARLRKSDIICRIGGDEFAVMLCNTDLRNARLTAENIGKWIQNFQYLHESQQISISCSIGICEINGEADNTVEYVKQADIALFVAKKRGRNLIHIYDPEDKDSEELRASINWVRLFRKAINDDQLSLHFQPVMHIKSGEISHYEALIRLDLPGEGMVLPGVFIPALEHAGELAMLDHWVIRKVIDLLDRYPTLSRVAINLSAQAFRDDALLPLVEECLHQTEVTPERIIFELTESASLANVSATRRMISELHELGCGFALDDFGTGFSTFSYLKEFPADCIKIDGSFISQLDNSPEDQALVQAINEVAKALGKKTVAEFVENMQILDLVSEIGIDYAQGHYIGKPCLIDELLATDNVSLQQRSLVNL